MTLRPQIRSGNAFPDYTRFLDDDSLEGARIGVWRFGPAPTYNEEVVGSVVEPILDDVIEALEDEGADVIDDGTTDIDLSATAGEFPALLCEFKTDIATYLETYVDGTNPVTGQPYPQTLAELIEFNQDHPELEGPWNDLVFEFAEATNGRDAECADIRAGVTPPVQDAIDDLMAEKDLDAIIALTNGPAWPTNDDPAEGDLEGRFGEFFVGSSGARRCRATPTSRCQPATSRGCRSGSRSSAAAGTNRSCSALPTTTSRRRRFVSRRSSSRRLATICSPASQARSAQARRQHGDHGQRGLVARFR